MNKIKKITKYVLASLAIAGLAIGLSLAVDMAIAAFETPGCVPPGCNEYEPIHIGGGTGTPQIKIGKLNIDPNNLLIGTPNNQNALSVYQSDIYSAIYAQQDNPSGYAIYASGDAAVRNGGLTVKSSGDDSAIFAEEIGAGYAALLGGNIEVRGFKYKLASVAGGNVINIHTNPRCSCDTDAINQNCWPNTIVYESDPEFCYDWNSNGEFKFQKTQSESTIDALSVKSNSSASAIYSQQGGSGYAGYFSGKSVFMNGNVGVGETNPASKLTVKANDANSAIYAEQSGSGYAGYFSGSGYFSGGTDILGKVRIGHSDSTDDAFSVKVVNDHSAIYAEQQGGGAAGYFSGFVNINGSAHVQNQLSINGKLKANGINTINSAFPAGYAGESKRLANLWSQPYTVPSGRFLSITRIFNPNSTTYNILVNEQAVSQFQAQNQDEFFPPLIVRPGAILKTADGVIVSALEMDLPQDMTIVNRNMSSSPYQVPMGKTLYITNAFNASSDCYLYIDGGLIYQINSNTRYNFQTPIVVQGNSTVNIGSGNNNVNICGFEVVN